MWKSFRYTREITPAIALATLATAFFYFAHRPVNNDVGWFMYGARGMLAGGHLYRDYVDFNAPMAYFAMLPAAALSRIPGFSNEAALTLGILFYVGIGFLLATAVLREMKLRERTRSFLACTLLFILCFLPHSVFGQREHIFAALMLPYILAAAWRSEKRLLPRNLAIACGIAAAFAASIKPQFLIVPVFIEAAVLLRQRSWKITFTPDVLAFTGSTAFIYAVCYLLYPLYWQSVLPAALALYGPYNNFRFLTEALLLQVPLFVFGFIAGEYRGRGTLIAARWMLTAATLGAFALFILQRKGWPYHALPILLFMSALFLFNLADLKKIHWRAGVSIIAIACTFVIGVAFGNVDPGMLKDVETYLQGTDGSFYIMSTGDYPAFPLALDPRTRWTSRYPMLFMIPAFIAGELNGAPPSPFEPGFHAAMLEDLRRNKPATVFLFQPVDAGGITGDQMLNWLRRDPGFDREWQTHYEWIGTSGPFAVFRRTD